MRASCSLLNGREQDAPTTFNNYGFHLRRGLDIKKGLSIQRCGLKAFLKPEVMRASCSLLNGREQDAPTTFNNYGFHLRRGLDIKKGLSIQRCGLKAFLKPEVMRASCSLLNGREQDAPTTFNNYGFHLRRGLDIKKGLSIQRCGLKAFVFDYLFGFLPAKLDRGYFLLPHLAIVLHW